MPDAILGGSPALRKLRSALPQLASDLKPIVIVGEVGTGKSLLASRIHALSTFKSNAAETINYSIMSERDQRIATLGGGPPELTTTRQSVLERSTTVSLKHVHCASQYLQEQLAQILIRRRLDRPGSNEERLVSCRFIFFFEGSPSGLARNGSLAPMLSSLILQSKTIVLPPLRKRREDIPVLASHFLERAIAREDTPFNSRPTLTSDLLNFLMAQRWGENALQLKAFIGALVIPPFNVLLAHSERIEIARIAVMIEEGKEFSLKQSLARIEDCVVRRALDKSSGCQSKAAQLLGMADRSIRHLQKTLTRSLVIVISSSIFQCIIEYAYQVTDLSDLL